MASLCGRPAQLGPSEKQDCRAAAFAGLRRGSLCREAATKVARDCPRLLAVYDREATIANRAGGERPVFDEGPAARLMSFTRR